MELHTVGVDGGYTQADVTAFSQVLTGWSIAGPDGWRTRGAARHILFRAAMHEPGSKVVMGKRYPDSGYDQGVAVLRDLAGRPATAQFIATKLARHFIADDPPPTAVERMARAFSQSGGDLPTVYRALIDSPEAWQQPVAKFKTPSDYIVSVLPRAGASRQADKAPVGLFQLLGQRIWAPGSPAGWPDRSADWDGASELLKRIEWADAVGQRVGPRRNAIELAPQMLGRRAERRRPVKAIAHAESARAGDRPAAGRTGIHEEIVMQRREFLTAGALAAGGALLSSRVTFAGMANGRKPRLVFVILRGALDGLAAVPACGDPGYAELRAISR